MGTGKQTASNFCCLGFFFVYLFCFLGGGGGHVRLYICFIKASVAFSTEANCIPAVRILHTIPCRSEGVLRDADLQ